MIYTKNFSQLQSCCRLFLSLRNDFLIREDQKSPCQCFQIRGVSGMVGHQPVLSLLGGSVVSLVLLECFSSKQIGDAQTNQGVLMGPCWFWAEILGSLIASMHLIFFLNFDILRCLTKVVPNATNKRQQCSSHDLCNWSRSDRLQTCSLVLSKSRSLRGDRSG